MTSLMWLIPAALFLGALGLAAFFWTMRSGQYDDMQGVAERILIDDDKPITDEDEDANEADSDRV
ncbi:cbb3-type cytochrome oxidase assembly protein CcoS [Alkalicaulis satelles]|uniref:Cbb3-type cytochrome oxidase assembly protein CcoS n=1 Tax=Alkalicaulis satelles TaxID=2609175 RepID=A0A5M6ZSQ9_9PROT|nr:cbb3-type cytochrome oxidase assembly protein CcoS [Alkalicaulis satelles]KAA5805361.1 cbb3-type cytochrome oxidase assembly protein CcoS [Alkalicaulis satelles]